ncbi:MAG: hypothetical protein PHR65_08420 [Syntrophomonadaceae bacterium]|nr:hypothetical protein [Syntrophomonadaceae bacterium]
MDYKRMNGNSSGVLSKELATWAGKSKFQYEGSVEQGTIIYYGRTMGGGQLIPFNHRKNSYVACWDRISSD